MAALGNPTNTIAVLQKYHFNFQKKFGQNFLIDPHVLEKIIAAAGIADVFGVGGVSFQRLHGSHHNGYDFLISLLTTMQNFLPRSILKVHKGFVALVDIK